MLWKVSLPFMKMMVQCLMTKPLVLCYKSYPGYEKLGRQLTWYFLIDKEKVVDQKRLYVETGYRYKADILLTKLDYASFISTNNIVSSDFFNANITRLLIFSIKIHRCFPKLSNYMAGKYEMLLILDPSFSNIGKETTICF